MSEEEPLSIVVVVVEDVMEDDDEGFDAIVVLFDIIRYINGLMLYAIVILSILYCPVYII